MTSHASKFEAFEIRDTDYKQINGHGIPASVLFPKHAQGGKRPLMVRWHGGGFVTGHRLFAEWIGDWILDLALQTNAVLVMPDYRLLPEATGADILSDVRSFFAWLLQPGNLQPHLPENMTPDLDNILVTGESAGGWLALQSGFHEPRAVKAVIAHYPMLDLRDQHYTQDYEKRIFEPPTPR